MAPAQYDGDSDGGPILRRGYSVDGGPDRAGQLEPDVPLDGHFGLPALQSGQTEKRRRCGAARYGQRRSRAAKRRPICLLR